MALQQRGSIAVATEEPVLQYLTGGLTIRGVALAGRNPARSSRGPRASILLSVGSVQNAQGWKEMVLLVIIAEFEKRVLG